MEFSKTAYGRRTQYGGITCADEKCIFSILEEKTYKGEGLNTKTPIKTEPNTLYFLRVVGKVVVPEWTNFQWGMCDSEGLRLENSLSKREQSFFVYRGGTDQELTIRGQDGCVYTRGYIFNSGSNSDMFFFTEGTEGEVVLSEVKLFKLTDAVPEPQRAEDFPANWVEDENTCEPDKNLIADLKAWAAPYAENCDFVEVSDDVIHYEAQGLGCYYIAWFPIEKPGVYDFCFKSKVLEKGDTRFGVLTQCKDGKRKFVMEKNASVQDKEDSYADMFGVPEGVKLGFAVFNRTGKVDFSDMKPTEVDNTKIKARYSEFS